MCGEAVRDPGREEVQALEDLRPRAEGAAAVWLDGPAHVRRDVSGHDPAVPPQSAEWRMHVSPHPAGVLRQHRRRVHGNLPRDRPAVRVRQHGVLWVPVRDPHPELADERVSDGDLPEPEDLREEHHGHRMHLLRPRWCLLFGHQRLLPRLQLRIGRLHVA